MKRYVFNVSARTATGINSNIHNIDAESVKNAVKALAVELADEIENVFSISWIVTDVPEAVETIEDAVEIKD